jgi:DHA2 family multidrug resistance protein
MSFGAASWLRIAQYLPMGFIFIPATLVAYIGLPQEKSNAIAGLINFVRNIGASAGTSAVTTILARRAQVHQVMLANHTGLGDRMFQNSSSGLTGSLQHAVGTDAQRHAYGTLYRAMISQASTLSYIDAFWILGVTAGIMFFASFLLRSNHPRKADPEALAH